MTSTASAQLQRRAQEGVKGKTPLQSIEEYLKGRESDIARAIPKHMSPDRLLRITLTLIEQTPRLLECSTASIIGGVLQAAQLGLEPGLLGECYLVPYRNNKKGIMEAQFQVGYRGYAKLALQSGRISTFEAHVVYERDGFDYAYGSQKFLKHRPYLGSNRGEIVAAYAIVETADGKSQFEIMPREDLNKVRASSRAKDDGPWVAWPEEMMRKTPAKRLAKYLQLSPQLSRAVAADETTKTEIAEDMANVIDATDWTHTGPPQELPAPQPEPATPQGSSSQEHPATPPAPGPRKASDKQLSAVWASAYDVWGKEGARNGIEMILANADLPSDLKELATNQASWLIDEIKSAKNTPAGDASHTSETETPPQGAPGDGMF